MDIEDELRAHRPHRPSGGSQRTWKIRLERRGDIHVRLNSTAENCEH